MFKKVATISIVLQASFWGIMIWVMIFSSIKVPIIFADFLQQGVTTRFLHPIYYGSRNVQNVFDHDLPGASVFLDNNTIVLHYDGTPNEDGTLLGYGYDQHAGIDYSLQYAPVLAGAEGTVLHAAWHNPTNHRTGYGLYVVIDHPETNYKTLYGHLSTLTVETGEIIEFDPTIPDRSDAIIGVSGNTGNVLGDCGAVVEDPTCGQHLHFEVRVRNVTYRPVNPYGWIGDIQATPVADPWETYSSDPSQNITGAASEDLWINYPAIIPISNDSPLQFPSGSPLSRQTQFYPLMVLDNSHSIFSIFGDCWAEVDDGTGFFDGSYHYAYMGWSLPPQSSENSMNECYVQWTISGLTNKFTGKYDIYAYIPEGFGTALNAVYTIQHNGQTSEAIIVQAAYPVLQDQPPNQDPEHWAYLGRYYFNFGVPNTQYIRLSNAVSADFDLGNSIVADAIKFIPVDPVPSGCVIGDPPEPTVPGLSAPENISWSVQGITNDQIRVLWNVDNEDGIQSYAIYRNTVSDVETADLVHSEPDAIYTPYEWDDSNVSNQTYYYYWLEVIECDGNRYFLGPKVAFPGNGSPPPPTLTSIQHVDTGSTIAERITWSPSLPPEGTAFNVYHSMTAPVPLNAFHRVATNLSSGQVGGAFYGSEPGYY
ncbi:MAG: peptidoglycan DD-metalloendopeptidase family protein, partial [Anaerolineales bacterium]|nr:peptidoglycan DD-metalloendopeptidase family protein [Anaerolineales bacterium]